jgi:5-methyltetrahydrofolate--homocysteine methyltransferase
MATVKGDVHDIGKNIVGVVLQCNNFEVVDLGVMASCEKILEAATREGANLIGLSGLITPSLDEMVHVAKEMQRLGYKQPLLIGGATTSPAHTAVKIDPQYEGAVIYVKDASRAVGVCQQLVTPGTRDAYVAHIKAEHERRREQHRNKSVKAPQLSLNQARAKKFPIDWARYTPPVPSFVGGRTFEDYPLDELMPYIDWMPFFNAWEFAGKFPDILTDPIIGEAASNLYADARRMLQTVVDEKWLRARAPSSASFPPTPWATTTSTCIPTRPGRRCACACINCGSRNPNRKSKRNYACRISWRRCKARAPTISARSQ